MVICPLCCDCFVWNRQYDTGNSISGALHTTFHVPTHLTGIVITVLALLIIVGGIKSISKVSSVVVPLMAIFLCDLWRYCHYRKYFESAGRHFDDFSDGIFGKSGRRRSVRNDCRFHDECNALWCGKRCIFQQKPVWDLRQLRQRLQRRITRCVRDISI